MKSSQLVSILLFCLQSFMYFCTDFDFRNFKYIVLIFTPVSVVFASKFGKSWKSVPYFTTLLVPILILLGSILLNDSGVEGLLIGVPLLYLSGAPSILKRLKIIWGALLESIWVYISIIVLLYLFGAIGFKLFQANRLYFWSEQASSLTFLQIATLDQIGRITKINYESTGFFLSIFILLCSLVFIHSISNVNEAFVLYYVAELTCGRPVANISRHKQVVGEHIPKPLRVIRILARIAGVVPILMPFMYSLQPVYVYSTLICAGLILLDDVVDDCKLDAVKQSLNVATEVLIMLTYFHQSHLLNYLLCVTRIFLIAEVKQLFRKLKVAVSTLPKIFSFSLFVFFMFSIALYLYQKRQETGTLNNKDIFANIIYSLQVMMLDDWVRGLRSHQWAMAVVFVLYVAFANHICINMLIAEVFNNVAIQDHEPSEEKKTEQVELERETTAVTNSVSVNTQKQSQNSQHKNRISEQALLFAEIYQQLQKTLDRDSYLPQI